MRDSTRRVASVGAVCRCPLTVQLRRDAGVAGARRAQREDAPDHRRLFLNNAAINVAVHPYVVIAEHAAARDVARLRLAHQGLFGEARDLSPIFGIHFGADEADDVVPEVPKVKRVASW
jgi:hypothetical protein